MLSLACQQAKIPLYVLCDTSKLRIDAGMRVCVCRDRDNNRCGGAPKKESRVILCCICLCSYMFFFLLDEAVPLEHGNRDEIIPINEEGLKTVHVLNPIFEVTPYSPNMVFVTGNTIINYTLSCSVLTFLYL